MKTVDQIMELANQFRSADGSKGYWRSEEALRTAIEELVADAARYQFMRHCSRAFGLDINGNHSWTCQITSSNVRGATLDAAIDAAMKESA